MLGIAGVILIALVFAVLSNNTLDQTPVKRVYRYPSPYCPNCATKYSWKDMVPFYSYLRHGGRCTYCNEKLPLRHILVDISELIWVTLYISKFGWSYNGMLAMVYGMALIAIFFLLKEGRELRDSLLIIMGMLAVIHFLSQNPEQFPEAAMSMILGAVLLAIYNLVKIFATEENEFELTELKLGALLGLFLGMDLGLIALFLSLSLGAIIGSINIKFFKKSKMNALPEFGELMIVSGLLVILWGKEFLQAYHSIIGS